MSLTDRLLALLAQTLREEPGEANGNMPTALAEEVATAHADWAAQVRGLRMLCGVRLVNEALRALEAE